ncbi:MAG: glycerophosphodiester phosphodiesterase family protein [Pseudomonadota bacterium]
MLPEPFLTKPIAHRGLHGRGAPENSNPACIAAMHAGYGIELDLQLSADGEAMVFHDATLDRMTDVTGPVRACNAEVLTAIPLRGSQTAIPTLNQVLSEVDGKVPLLIELKDQSGKRGGSDGMLEKAVAEALESYDGPVAVMSFNPSMVAQMAQLSPETPRGLTTGAFDWPDLAPEAAEHLRAIADFGRVGASFISHDHRHLDARPVTALRTAGVPILTWTIRSAEEEAKAREIAQNVTFEGYLP